MRSFELLVDIPAEGELPYELAFPGRPVLGSKGLLKLAPDMPNTISPLYSPPYSVLAQPDIDSVMLSEDNVPVLLAQNSASWSLSVPVVPSFLPETLALSVHESPAESETENVQTVCRSRVSIV